jgi:hypothetical protein
VTTQPSAAAASDRAPRSSADVARAHREAWAAALCAGRRVLALRGGVEGLRELEAALEDASEPWDAVTWLDDAGEAIDERGRSALAAAAARRWLVVIAVPSALDGGEGWELARDLAAALGEATLLPQWLAEGSLIGAGEEDVRARLLGERGDVEDAAAWLVCSGASEEELTAAGASSRLRAVAMPVHRSYVAALERANAELERANARLGRARLGRHDAAAAVAVRRLTAAEQRVAELEQRLEVEIEVARQNDRNFQAVRAHLDAPHHRVAESLSVRLRKVPGMSFLGRLVWRFASRLFG